MKKKILSFVLVLAAALIVAIPVLAARPIHKVHVGGPDACEAWGLGPGCDANFSLVVTEHADGSVTGQWSDQYGRGYGGVHVVIDCLGVNGNQAWIGGLVTQDTFSGDGSFIGFRVAASVVDNGTSANDPPDQISYMDADFDNSSCAEQPDFDLFDIQKGQVIVD
jgi:hypothetical protein